MEPKSFTLALFLVEKCVERLVWGLEFGHRLAQKAPTNPIQGKGKAEHRGPSLCGSADHFPSLLLTSKMRRCPLNSGFQ